MEVLTEPTQTADLLAEIRKNYPLALLCILPGIENRVHKLKSCAKQLGIGGAQYDKYQKLLIETNIWKIEAGKMIANFELLDLGDLTVQDHMAMTVNIISRLSGTSPYEYESLSLVTRRPLVKSFISKVRKALKELYQESRENPELNDCIFSWTQTGMAVVEVESKKAEDTGAE